MIGTVKDDDAHVDGGLGGLQRIGQVTEHVQSAISGGLPAAGGLIHHEYDVGGQGLLGCGQGQRHLGLIVVIQIGSFLGLGDLPVGKGGILRIHGDQAMGGSEGHGIVHHGDSVALELGELPRAKGLFFGGPAGIGFIVIPAVDVVAAFLQDPVGTDFLQIHLVAGTLPDVRAFLAGGVVVHAGVQQVDLAVISFAVFVCGRVDAAAVACGAVAGDRAVQVHGAPNAVNGAAVTAGAVAGGIAVEGQAILIEADGTAVPASTVVSQVTVYRNGCCLGVDGTAVIVGVVARQVTGHG